MTKRKKPVVCISFANTSDLAAIHAIDQECFGDYAMSRRWFSRHLMIEDGVVFAIVARCFTTKRVIGYAMAEFQGDQVMIMRLAVMPMHRRKGYGRHMLAQIQVDAPPMVGLFYMTVPDNLLDAHLFFRGCGWYCTGVKKQAFKKRGCDGYRFTTSPLSEQ